MSVAASGNQTEVTILVCARKDHKIKKQGNGLSAMFESASRCFVSLVVDSLEVSAFKKRILIL